MSVHLTVRTTTNRHAWTLYMMLQQACKRASQRHAEYAIVRSFGEMPAELDEVVAKP